MKPAFFLLRLISLHLALALCSGSGSDFQFAYHGFTGTNLTLDGNATVKPDGILVLTSRKTNLKGHAFFPTPLQFRTSPNGTARSFSAAFVFAIVSDYTNFSAHSMAFIMSPTKNFTTALPAGYLALLNFQNNGNTTNHLFANLTLFSREAMQVWVDYDGNTGQIDVALAPIKVAKPRKPLVSAKYDLSTVLTKWAYIGFSSATGEINSRHYLLGWSFAMNGPAPPINIANLPKLPRFGPKPPSKVLVIVLPIATATVILSLGTIATLLVLRHLRYDQLLEDWELEFGPHRFSYKDLYHATNGFKSKHLLGTGGFGQVYKGVLRKSKLEVAVKKVSHESRQGMKEFISEVVTIGCLPNRNLVQLHGYCRRKSELLLVYEYMPNGSLDKYLYCQEDKPLLDWSQRFHIIRGVASGLLYIHEKWEKVVIHHNIKASNVLIDRQMNGCLGDFGLSRLYDHGTDPQTTHVVGTMGYLAPELIRTGKASKLTDVFVFGAFLLEITCGQRPVNDYSGRYNQEMLVDWVRDHFNKGSLNETVDLRLQGDCNTDEACRVLKLGLLCSHPSANLRPGMRQVMQYLDGDTPLPDLTSTNMSFSTMALMQNEGFDSYPMSYPSSAGTIGTVSFLSGGR
uniref:non-specific serine/threonine protein kinase n=1 Tax=Oryza glumipatula TaxID=40148 RepID=A0A0E0AHU2_9ORYZ